MVSYWMSRVEDVAQAVADQVDGDDGHHQQQARERAGPPGGREVLAALGQHAAPARAGGMIPSPRNESDASARITRTSVRVNSTSTEPAMFGRM